MQARARRATSEQSEGLWCRHLALPGTPPNGRPLEFGSAALNSAGLRRFQCWDPLAPNAPQIFSGSALDIPPAAPYPTIALPLNSVFPC